jgi:DNA-directed RNA polymerase subunit RPC12/RpoP
MDEINDCEHEINECIICFESGYDTIACEVCYKPICVSCIQKIIEERDIIMNDDDRIETHGYKCPNCRSDLMLNYELFKQIYF